MKVQRYTYGRTNVDELQAQRGAALTPKEAAEAAAVPYEGVAQIAGAAADTLVAFDEIQKQEKATRAKTAATDAQIQTSFMANALENLPVEAEKNGWTAEQMRESGRATLKAYDDSLNAIDPEFRDELRSAWQMNKAMYAQQIAGMTMEYEDALNRQKVGTSWIAAVEAKDPIQMQMVKNLSIDLGYTDPAEAAKMDSQINVVNDERTVDAIYNEWRQSDNPEKVHADLVNNDSIDKDIKKSAIAQIEGQINNEASADKQRTQQAAIGFERQVTDYRMLAKQNKLSLDMIDDLVKRADSFGSPALSNKASGWRNSLYLATLEGVKTGVDNTVFARQLSMGPGSVVGSEKTYKQLQSYAEEIIPDGATPEERDLIENNLSRVAGFPTARIHGELKAAGAGFNARPLIRAATRILEITDGDPYTGIDLGLTGDEMANVMRVTNAMTNGLDPTEVAEEVVANNKAWRDDKVVTSQLQKQSGGIDTEEAFDELFNNAYDEMVYGPWGQADITTPEETTARIRYNQYVEEAYIRNGGDEESAILTANMRFQQTHAMTYINGEPELQFGGIRAGSAELGDVLWESDLKGMTVIGLNDDDSYVMTIENRDDVKFRNPKIINGRQHYQVYVNDRPAFSETDVGRRSIYVVVDEDAELQVQGAADAEEIKGIQKKIRGLEIELKQAQGAEFGYTFNAVDRFGMPLDIESTVTKDTQTKTRDIPKEIALLQRQLRNLK